MDNTTYYQRNREILLNRAKDYYENNKEKLREQARNKCKNLFEEDKNIKREYGKYHIIICLKKRSKNGKNIKNENIEKQKSLRIMNKIMYLNKLTEINA